MFALGVQYLMGVVYATDPASRQRPEWPLHPDRVFMAMVAAHHETDADPHEREALLWLERLGAPAIAAGPTGQSRQAVTSFVPVNDTEMPRLTAGHSPSTAQLDTGASLLPDHRSRQPRTFPAVVPQEPTAFLIWPDAGLEGTRVEALDRLCRKVVRIGHSASLVQMWVEATPPEPTLLPNPSAPRLRLRVPGGGRLVALEARYPRLRPSPGLWSGYGHRRPDQAAAAAGSVFSPDLLVFRRVRGRALGLQSTAILMDTARRAILAHASQPVHEWVSGHAPDGSPSTRPHLALLPLADVGHDHADGHLLGLAVAVPRTLAADAVAAALGNVIGAGATGELGRLAIADGDLLDWEIELDLRAAHPTALEVETWTATPAGARQWASVTPVVLDRYPKRDGDAERTIMAACEHAGLPRPSNVVTVPVSVFAGAPTTWSMPSLSHPARRGSRAHTHVIFTFPEPVCGPVIVGAGRYRGYGLCRPVPRV